MRFGVMLCLVGALASGCIFSPKKNNDKPPDKPPVVYPPRTTAKGAVWYLSVAWSERDSVRIDSVYADDYLGSSVDLTDQGGVETLQFTKSDEVHTVGALARNSEIDYTNMDLMAQQTWTELQYANDPPDWLTIQVPNFKIVVSDIRDNDFTATAPNNEIWVFEFTLRPTYPAWAGGNAIWEIVRWVESRSTQ